MKEKKEDDFNKRKKRILILFFDSYIGIYMENI